MNEIERDLVANSEGAFPASTTVLSQEGQWAEVIAVPQSGQARTPSW
ncbi:hypothetical protein [Paracoccus sulfuroxidans]|nr:hypothetical protein [Paracoccus sulfuroxidans]